MYYTLVFYYETDDSGTIKDGFYVDNIEITVNGETILDDNGTDNIWTFENFTPVSETVQDTTQPVIDQPHDIQIEQP